MPRRDVNPTAEIAKALAKLKKASFGDILKEADISRQALDIHLKRMLDKKLILSERDPKDKRKYLYWLNPNELAIITVDEVIEAIKDELKAVGEELKPDEEEKLREFLIKYIRKRLISRYLKEEAYKKLENPLYYVLGLFSTAVMYRLDYDSLLKKIGDKSKADEVFKKILNAYLDYLKSVEDFELNEAKVESVKELAIASKDYISSELAKKWKKTKIFKDHPPYKIYQAILAMSAIFFNKKIFELLTELNKLSKSES